MSWDRFWIFWSRNGLFLVLSLALVAGLAAAVRWRDLDLGVAVLAGFFGLLTAFFAGRFALAVERDPDRPGLESHWGGLGGGLGGWRVSTSLVYLMAAVAFGGLLALTAGLALSGADGKDAEDGQEAAATADADEPTADVEASEAAADTAGGEAEQQDAPAATDANAPAPAAPAGGGNQGAGVNPGGTG